MWISGKYEVFPAWSSWKGRRHSAGSDMVQTNQEMERELPFLNGVLALFFGDKMTKDPWLFWRGGWKLRCESLARTREPGQGQFWNARSSQQRCWARAGPVLKHQKQPAVMLSQGRASSETPEAASSDVEPGQGQFWNTRSSQQWCWARAGPVLKHQKQPAVMLSQGKQPQPASGMWIPPKAIRCFARGGLA